MRPFLMCLLAAILAGCAADPDYYLLPPPQPAEPTAVAAHTIMVMEFGLPGYAEAAEIALLGENGAVEVNDAALWADAPRRALTRHMIVALQARLEAEVAGDPWPGFDRPDLQVEVVVDRMIGVPGGVLQFAGTYSILSPDGVRSGASERFALAVPIPGAGYPALLAAHARAVDALADLVAARIARTPGTS